MPELASECVVSRSHGAPPFCLLTLPDSFKRDDRCCTPPLVCRAPEASTLARNTRSAPFRAPAPTSSGEEPGPDSASSATTSGLAPKRPMACSPGNPADTVEVLLRPSARLKPGRRPVTVGGRIALTDLIVDLRWPWVHRGGWRWSVGSRGHVVCLGPQAARMRLGIPYSEPFASRPPSCRVDHDV